MVNISIQDSFSPTSLGQAAEAYARQGRRVFPLAPDSKKPYFKDWPWQEAASNDPDIVADWWSQWPECNIGIVADDLTIVDVDRKNGKDGWTLPLEPGSEKTVGHLIDQNTLTVATPNGGWHFYYRGAQEHLKGRPGVDIQQGLKYVAAPPSRTPEGVYQQLNGSEIASIPPDLKDFLGKAQEAPPAGDVPDLLESPPPMPLGELEDKHLAFLERGEVMGFPSRSEAIQSIGARLYQLGYDDAQALTMLWNHPMVQDTALEHRRGSDDRGLKWIWDGLKKLQHHKPKAPGEVFTEVPDAPPADPYGNLLKDIRDHGTADPLDPQTINWSHEIIAKALKLDPGRQDALFTELQRVMGWSTRKVLDANVRHVADKVREQRQIKARKEATRYVFVAEANQFWDLEAQTFVGREGINGRYNDWNTREATAAKILLSECRKVDKMTYVPGQPEITTDPQTHKGTVLNTWRPSSLVPAPPWDGDPGPWLEHVKLIVPDPEARGHILDWLAFQVQYRGEKVNWHPLIGGDEGIGKDTIFWPVIKYLGDHNVVEIPATQLLEEYEDYLLCEVLSIHEAQTVSRQDQSKVDKKLKRMKASPPITLRVRMFGQKHQMIPNTLGVWTTTNNRQRALNVGAGDRRNLVYWSPVTKPADEYFPPLYRWLNQGGGNETVARFLLDRDLSGFNAGGTAPWTAYKAELTESSQSDLETSLRHAIEDGTGAFGRDLVRFEEVEDWMRGKDWAKGTKPGDLADALQRIGCRKHRSRVPGELKHRSRVPGELKQPQEYVRYWCVRNCTEWEGRSTLENVRVLFP